MSDNKTQGSLLRCSVPLFNEALRDSGEDLSTGPVRRAGALLAIPMMLEMAMQLIFAVVSELLLTILSVLVFRRGRWKHNVA